MSQYAVLRLGVDSPLKKGRLPQVFCYSGPVISVSFADFPHLQPLLLATHKAWFFQRFWGARSRRRFALVRDWVVQIDVPTTRDQQLQQFAGTIVIPGSTRTNGDTYDGASVPLPWIVTALTLGTLRPLGILLIASIVHDYAFRHGKLNYIQNGTRVTRCFQRHDVDQLFREIIKTVNKTPFLAYVAWFAVRIGWLGVKYNGARRTGNAPVGHLVVLGLLMALLMWGLTFPSCY